MKRFLIILVILSVVFGSITGVYAKSGRSEEREYSLTNLNLSFTTDNKNVEIPDFVAPFDVGSIKVTYTATGSGVIYINENGTKISEASFKAGANTTVCDVRNISGIKKGSTIGFSSWWVGATITAITLVKENSPGDDYYTVDMAALNVGRIYGSEIKTYSPFNTSMLEFSYDFTKGLMLTSDTLKVKINGTEYQTTVSETGSVARIYLSESIKPQNVVLDFKHSVGTLTINGVTFYKENKIWPQEINKDIDYTPYEKALQTSVVFKNGANIYKSKNAVRYLSHDDVKTEAFTQNNLMYAPVKALADAFDLYMEENATDYVYRSSDNKKQLTVSKTECVNECYPVKTVAEFFVFTVIENGDYLIADKISVRANEAVGYISDIQAEFDGYLKAPKEGKTYYVSANAKTGGDGSEETPFKTIQAAADVAVGGDKVLIKGGIYRETVTPKNTGTATNPIIFEAANGENVTVSAFDEISGFAYYGDGIYVAELKSELDFGTDLVLYNREVLAEGRQPNSNTSGFTYNENIKSPLWPTKGSIKTPVSSTIAVSDTELLNAENNALRGATYFAFKGAGWGGSYGKVMYSEKGAVSLKDLHYMNYFGTSNDNDWGYLTNSKKTLDQPGEWYVADKALYMILPTGVGYKDFRVEARARYVSFDLTDKSCIVIKNINTEGASFVMTGNSELNVINGGTHKYVSHFTYPMDKNGLLYENITSNESPILLGKSGNLVAGENNAVVNTKIESSAGAGLILAGRYGYVSGNTILETNYSGSQVLAPIMISAQIGDKNVATGGHKICFNTVSMCGRRTLGHQSRYIDNNSKNQVIPFIGSDISYNELSLANVLARDSGIIYDYRVIMGNDLVNTEIHHNVIHDSAYSGRKQNPAMYIGAYADNMTGNGIIHHNIFYYEGDFYYDPETFTEPEYNGSETYLYAGAHVQSYSQWGRTYSTVQKYDNKGDETLESGRRKPPQHTQGFNKEDASNYPDGIIFNYGA